MKIEGVAPWVAKHESDHPNYWIIFWSKPSVSDIPEAQVAWESDEFRLTDVTNLDEVVAWANSDPERRAYTMYCEFTVPGTTDLGICRLVGVNPTQTNVGSSTFMVGSPEQD